MTVVIKLGGSLLELDGLAARLQAVIDRLRGQRCLIVPGGGGMADRVRDWSRIHQLQDEMAHWLAIRCIDLNGQLVRDLLGCEVAHSRETAETLWNCGHSTLVLNMTQFLTSEEAVCRELSHDWNVTSDSLAAWTAIRWPASELILLKSIPVPRGMSAHDASDQEWVDPYFPRLAGRIDRIQWCNLRSSDSDLEKWL